MRQDDKDRMQAFYGALGEQSAAYFNAGRGNELRTMDFFGPAPRKNHRYYVAVCGDTVAGHLFIWDTDTRVPWMGIAVRDDFQGKGVGTRMLTELFRLLKEEGRGGLLLRTAQSNVPAQRLYEKCGFERIGTHPTGEYLYVKRFEDEI